MIEIKNINQFYHNKHILKDVSLNIPENKITALIGPNGAGKSTLLGVVSRLIKQKEGDVFLDGKNMKDMKSNEIAKQLAFLRQSNYLNLKITVRELVTFGRFPHSQGRINDEDIKYIEDAIKFMKLEDIENSFINELSGGQQQRAYIAMVLAQNTKYVFLDEPLNNLDMKYSVEMMTILEKLVNDLGKTVVVVMHDINIASAFCHHIVAMKDGVVINEGTPDEIVDKKILDAIFDHDFCIAGINGKRVCVYHNILEEIKIEKDEIR